MKLFGETSADLARDLLGELANILQGALTASFDRAKLAFKGKTPQALAGDKLQQYLADCPRTESFVLAMPNAKILVTVGLAPRKNVSVALAALREGMVVAKDIVNAQGVLMVRAESLITNAMADRLREALPPDLQIMVAGD